MREGKQNIACSKFTDKARCANFAAMQNPWDDTIQRALAEDLGDGDHSSNCSIPAEAVGRMQLIIKEKGILAGLHAAQKVFAAVDPRIEWEALLPEGAQISPGEIGFRLKGPVRAMLRGERVALNILQRMSGIASYTHYLQSLIAHTPTRLLDTRKTTPGLRFMEKEAVRVGGGENHRMGLYDMIMLKDNHIDFAGGVQKAIRKAKQYLAEQGLQRPIEVETRNLEELQAVLDEGGVQRVMFDNYSPALTRQAVQMVQGKIETESSGGITETNLRDYAETGVDFISIGALTHSARSLDMSLKARS